MLQTLDGTAVDAAIATLFCNGLISSHSMGVGGGFLMTIYDKSSKKVTTIDAREAAPARVSLKLAAIFFLFINWQIFSLVHNIGLQIQARVGNTVKGVEKKIQASSSHTSIMQIQRSQWKIGLEYEISEGKSI